MSQIHTHSVKSLWQPEPQGQNNFAMITATLLLYISETIISSRILDEHQLLLSHSARQQSQAFVLSFYIGSWGVLSSPTPL